MVRESFLHGRYAQKEIFPFIYLLYGFLPFRGLIFQLFATMLSSLRRIRAACSTLKQNPPLFPAGDAHHSILCTSVLLAQTLASAYLSILSVYVDIHSTPSPQPQHLHRDRPCAVNHPPSPYFSSTPNSQLRSTERPFTAPPLTFTTTAP